MQGFGADDGASCAQDKQVLQSNVDSLRTSYVNAKKFAVVGIIAAGLIGFFIGKK